MTTDTLDDPFFDLMFQWQEAYEAGRELSPAELAPGDPALQVRLAEEIAYQSRLKPRMPDIPGYLILHEINRGGMGVVYAAEDTRLSRDVAVKVLKSEFADRDSLILRFNDEAKIAAQLQHPGIPPVHELGLTADGRPFLAMKLIKGRTLAELLTNKGLNTHNKVSGSCMIPNQKTRIDDDRILELIEQIAQTLAYAHSRGIVHRDLKPANVMVGAFGEIQVMDWGLAKVIGGSRLSEVSNPDEDTIAPISRVEIDRTPDSETQAGSILGTPAYMPPEQANGQVGDIDERSDVFAIGGILCEMISGQPTYIGDKKNVIALAVTGNLEETHERLKTCETDNTIFELALGCLQADRNRRIPTAAEIVRRITTHRENRANQRRLFELENERAKVELAEQGKRFALEAEEREKRFKIERFERAKRVRVWQMLAATIIFAVVGLTLFIVQRYHVAQELTVAQTKLLEAELDQERIKKSESLKREQALKLAQVELSFQRGLLKEGIHQFEEAKSLGATPPIGLHLTRLMALQGLNREVDVRNGLDAIDSTKLDPSSRANWHIIKAETLMAHDDAGMLRELERAVATKAASEAELAYIEGLRADTALKARDYFQKAINLRPNFLAPRVMDAVVLLSLGRLEKLIDIAKGTLLLYPDEPQSPLMLVLAYGLRDRMSEANILMPIVKKHLQPSDYRLLHSIMPLLRLANYPKSHKDIRSINELSVHDFLLTNATMTAMMELSKKTKDIRLIVMTYIRFPRSAKKYINFLLETLLERFFDPKVVMLRRFGINKGASLLNEKQMATLANLCDVHPEGYLHFLYAEQYIEQLWQKRTNDPYMEQVFFEKWQRDSAACALLLDRASQCEGFLFNERLTCIDNTIMTYAIAGSGNQKFGIPKNKKYLSLASQAILYRQKYHDSSSISLIPMNMVLNVAVSMSSLGEFIITQQLIDLAKIENPNDFTVIISEAALACDFGAFDRALDLVADARNKKVSDPGKVLDNIEQRCREAIAKRKKK